jgi:hypothetical protein
MATSDPTSNTGGAPQNAPSQNGAAKTKALAPLPPPPPDGGGAISAFASIGNFEAAQRMAIALSNSTLVPVAYQGSVPNCLIAMEMASRMSASVFMIMQNLDIIHGKPSFSSKFLIGTVNASQRFTPLRFRWFGKPFSNDWGCRAVAKDRESGEELEGPLVTIQLAKDEGWIGRKGSKWQTLPELMLMYRSAGFWTRVYCPELSLGLGTTEEIVDTTGYVVPEGAPQLQAPAVIGNPKDLESEILTRAATMAAPSGAGAQAAPTAAAPVAPTAAPTGDIYAAGEPAKTPTEASKPAREAKPKAAPPADDGTVPPDQEPPAGREPGSDG